MISAVACLLKAQHYAGVDFFQYWAVPEILSQESDAEIYSQATRAKFAQSFREQSRVSGSAKFRAAVEHRKAELRLSSSPLLYAAISPFRSNNYDRDLERFQLFAVCCAAFSLGLLCRLHRFSLVVSCLIISGYFLIFEPAASDLRVGNVNQLQLAQLAILLWLLHAQRYVWAGAVLASAILFKLNFAAALAFLLLSMIAQRRFADCRALLLGGLCGGLASAALASFYFGTPLCWLHWLRSTQELLSERSIVYGLDMGNLAFAKLLGTAAGDNAGANFAQYPGLAVGLLPIIFVLRAGLRLRQHAGAARETAPFGNALDAPAVCFGVICLAFVSRLFWMHYFVLFVPAILLVVADQQRTARGQIVAALVLLPWMYIAAASGLNLHVMSPLFQACVLHFAALLLLALLLRKTGNLTADEHTP